MARTWRTITQSIISPVLSTALYFVVFGSAIGSRIERIGEISYGAFIVPGLIMLSVLTQSISNASFGIYFPKFTGTIYELLSAPVSYFEIVLSYVGAAATKSVVLGLIILATAGLFVPLHIAHPVWMMVFLLLTAVTFSLLGFIIGIWADGFEKLQLVPLLIITPLTFLGGSFYSIDMLPPFWQKVTLFNPVVYLISGFRWSFYGLSDVSVSLSLAMTLVFMPRCRRARRQRQPRTDAEGGRTAPAAVEADSRDQPEASRRHAPQGRSTPLRRLGQRAVRPGGACRGRPTRRSRDVRQARQPVDARDGRRRRSSSAHRHGRDDEGRRVTVRPRVQRSR